MNRLLFKGCSILTMVQGDKPFVGDLLIEGSRISRIAASIDQPADSG